ncbi:class I SAM-dependent methyltransferase [Candidatus Bipolaricaulota sp. J31]
MRIGRRISGLIGAAVYDALMWPLEAAWGRGWRESLWEGIRGRVLEIGVGTGANVPFYPREARVVGVDLGAGMLARARRKAARTGAAVELIEADIHSLPFAEGEFDYVVGSFVLCSVRDPLAALNEVRRVLHPEGEVRLLEHVRPHSERLGRTLELVVPHFAKRTGKLFPAVGFEVLAEMDLDKRGLVRLFRLRRA